MRALGLDFGSKTVGVAISDPLYFTAQGLEIIRREDENKLRKTLARIEAIIEEYEDSLKGYTADVLIEECVEKSKVQELRGVEILDAKGVADDTRKVKSENMQYFTGHTKRYVKVKVVSDDNMINQIVKVKIL